MTQKDKTIYLHILEWKPEGIEFNGIVGKPSKAYFLADAHYQKPLQEINIMKTLLKSFLLTLFCLAGVAAHAAGTPDTQWTYKTINGKALKMDVFLPEGYASAEKSFPAIVFYHGGGWSGGKVSWHHPDCAYWSKRGMIAVSVDYRLMGRDQVEECVKDAKSAVRFLRKNAEALKVDVDKVVVAGGSAGGQMAAAVAMIDKVNDPGDDLAISCKPNAVVLYNPYFKCEDELSPPNFVVEGLPPMISFLGSEDPSVTVESIKAFHEDLQKAGNVSEFYVGKGGKHGFCIGTKEQNRFFYWSLELVDAFLVKHGLLTGGNLVIRPAGVEPLQPEEFEAYPSVERRTQGKPPVVSSSNPNIVYILADDLGYGDVQCLNPERGKIATPHLDKLAAQGMSFTDAHTSSSVCTPTRYGVLTGRYNWRTRLQKGVLHGFDKPLIAPNRLTVAGLLKQHGYTTACIGKWHLGLGIPKGEPSPIIPAGPITCGFDRFFGIAASLDMPPFAFIDNDHFTEPLTTTKKFKRSGPAAASFEAVDVLPTLTRKAVEFVTQEAKTGQPFFLYLPLNSPHTPIVPSKEWQGKSGLGSYGDFVMQTDWAVGQVLAAIDQAGVGSNTLVIMTSDNGCSPAARIPDLQDKGHFPNGDFRGMKADIFDGGHRVPFFVRWPGQVKPGSRSAQIICLTDFMATCADIVGAKLPDTAGEDSVSILPALLGTDKVPLRESVVHHSFNGSFAIREGNWKLELCSDSGGFSNPKPGSAESKRLPDTQLYSFSGDVTEAKNLQAEHPEIVARLTKDLEQIIANGRSTPGAKQANDAEIKIRK